MTGLAGGLAVELDSLDGMLSALDGIGCEPRRTGSGWSLRCPHPGHEDDTPSATLRPGDSAPWLLHCHGCNPRPDDKPRWLAECVARVAAGTPLAPASP